MKRFLFIIPLIFPALYVYRTTLALFFQQDEWFTFGVYLSYILGGSWADIARYGLHLDFLRENKSLFTHFTPLTRLVQLIQISLFKGEYQWYAMSSLVLHGVSILLVYIFFRRTIGDRRISLFAAYIFGVNSFYHQATTWMGTQTSTHFAFIFLMISLIFFHHFITHGKRFHLILSYSMLFVSILFKESALFLPVLYPIWAYIQRRPSFRISLYHTITFITLIFIPRVVIYMMLPNAPSSLSEKVMVAPFPLVLLFRLLTVPLKVLAQSFVPVEWIIKISEFMVDLAYPLYAKEKGTTAYDVVTQTVISDGVSYFVAFLLLIFVAFVGYLLFTRKKMKEVKYLFAAVAFILLSSLPYIVIPKSAGYFTFVESRYLNVPGIASSFLIAFFIWNIVSYPLLRRIRMLLLMVILIVFTLYHNDRLQRLLRPQYEDAETRRTILTAIFDHYPSLSNNSIYYAQSNKVYYGLPETEPLLPFQSGLGQTLLVWYHFHGSSLPSCMYENAWLYGINEQGYKRCDGKGFGYYHNFEKLKLDFENQQFSISDIRAFAWDGNSKQLTEITSEVRERLQLHR